jgi:retron-type reverse transcriptase
MTKLDECFTDNEIIKYLCKIRVSKAQRCNKKHLLHLLTKAKKHNYHLNNKEDKEFEKLQGLLPSRRKWKKLGMENRYKDVSGIKIRISSVEYNQKSLLKTVKYYRKKSPKEQFVIALNLFIQEIKDSVNSDEYVIESPEIEKKFKKKDKKRNISTYRPISIYPLKERIIIGLVSKYFTKIFDKYFSEQSYAFRQPPTIDEKKKKSKIQKNHHEAIQTILDYRKKHDNTPLWVSECDIKKFYDSVHHKTLKYFFKKLIKQTKKNCPASYDIRAENLFYKYLDSYSFVKNVLPKNKRMKNGEFGWVEKELKESKLFKSTRNLKLGVPQGGALSGLISNILLDSIDKKLESFKDPDLLYVRYCDDMVIIHPDKEKCKKYSEIYEQSLKKMKLFSHPFQECSYADYKSFWNKKSKKPYRWYNEKGKSFYWFGFVGYEISFDGDLRVRKSSLRKEKDKQKKVVSDIVKVIKTDRRKSKGYILESAINRLNGMAIGRANLRNYRKLENEMCWANGFHKLNDNKTVRSQMRELDKFRSLQKHRLKKIINKLEDNEESTFPKEDLFIKEEIFSEITDFDKQDSLNVRNELKNKGLLSDNFSIKDREYFKVKDKDEIKVKEIIDLGLSEKYLYFYEEILEIIRDIIYAKNYKYYGKPYSYYYHIVEKKLK